MTEDHLSILCMDLIDNEKEQELMPLSVNLPDSNYVMSFNEMLFDSLLLA